MKTFAVAFASLLDNDLKVEIIKAEDIHSAIMQHTAVPDDMPVLISNDLDKIKDAFFNCDCLIAVVEVPA